MSRKSRRLTVPRQCLVCGKEFFPIARQVAKGLGLYCSQTCAVSVVSYRPPRLMTTEERFWRHVVKDNGPIPERYPELGPCWDWIGSTASVGAWKCGKLGKTKSSNGKTLAAYRVSWEIHYGPIPDGLCVLHKCDRAICCNPKHLFLGTNAQNTQDMIEKGRHPNIHLNIAIVHECRRRRAAGETVCSLAVEFGVTKQTMSKAINGRTWTYAV
jgi:hypothetical protein